jgi:hypothetical protein
MVALCKEITVDLVATHMTNVSQSGVPLYSHTGWELMSPHTDIYMESSAAGARGGASGLFGKEAFSVAMELNRVGVRAAIGSTASLATVPLSESMEAAFAGIALPGGSLGASTMDELIGALNKRGIVLKDLPKSGEETDSE